MERARSFAKRIEAPLAIIDKRRDRPNQATATHVIGDVDGKIAVLVDDIIDTAGTICAGAEVLLREGAHEVYACAHARRAFRPRPRAAQQLGVHQGRRHRHDPSGERLDVCSKLQVVSVASLLAKSIHNIHTGSSVSVLF